MLEPSEPLTSAQASTQATGRLFSVRLQRIKIYVLHYWWIVALTCTIGAGIKVYLWSQAPLAYVSVARMMVNGQVQFAQSTAYAEEAMNFYGTQVALMKAPTIVNEAKQRVLAMHPDAEVDEMASVDAAQEPRTSIFNLQVVANNPHYAQYLLDAVMDCYLSEKKGRKAQNTDEAVTAITEEIANLDTEIKKDGEDELSFEKDNNVVFIEQQSSSAANYLVGLNDENARLTKERDLLMLANSDKNLSGPDSLDTIHDSTTPNTTDTATANLQASIRDQETNLEKLKILRQDYSTYLKDMHPKMVALAEAIDQGQKFLDMLESKNAEGRQNHLADLNLQIENLQKQIADWNSKSLDLNQRLTTYQQLKEKITRETTMYDQLAASFQNLNLNKSIDQTDVAILTQATPGSTTQSPLYLQLIYGLLGGAAAGLAITYFLHRLDDTIDSPLALKEQFDTPLIGMVPLSARSRKNQRVPLISENDERHILVESFRDIRSYILFRSNKNTPLRSLMICSAEPNEGKSTIAANIAITFAMGGMRVLLIDADMRMGLLHTLFEVPNEPGLSELLQQQAPWQKVLRKTSRENLDLIPRGKASTFAGELLLGSQTDLLFTELAPHYDIVVWDSVPLLAADDAANLCPKVDGIILVARARTSSTASVRNALEIITPNRTNLFGIVLNGVAPNQPGYHNRYQYKKYYQARARS